MPSVNPSGLLVVLRREPLRAKTGCITCRQARKKCDEVRPRCSRCERTRRECIWASLAPSKGRTATKSTGEYVSLESTEAMIASTGVLEPAWALTPNQALLLTPQSATMLRYYIESLKRSRYTRQPTQNAYAAAIIPIAYEDDLVMHCLIATGGAHFHCLDQARQEIQVASLNHYSSLLRGLRDNVARLLSSDDTSQVIRLALILLLTACFEGVSSSCLTGGIFAHLRACRQLLVWLLNPPRQPDRYADADRYLLGVVLEHYTYLVLINTITPYGLLPARTLPYDAFVTAPLHLAGGRFPTAGMVFCGYHDLFALIPDVALLGACVLREEAQTCGLTSSATTSRAAFLAAAIDAWELPAADGVSGESGARRRALGEVLQHGLRIFLATAMLGSRSAAAGARDELQGHAIALMQLTLSSGLTDSPLAPLLLWPSLMAGSVMVDGRTRQMLARGWREASYVTWIGVRALELLERLWGEQEEDHRAWGPSGLSWVMEKYGIDICMA